MIATMTACSTSRDRDRPAATAPPEEMPAKMPSFAASSSVVRSASVWLTSMVRSTRVASKMEGRYSSGQRRIPGIDEPSVGVTPTISIAG